MIPDQAAVILLNSSFAPLYVSTEAARILLSPDATENMAEATHAMAKVVQSIIAEDSGSNEAKFYGVIERGEKRYLFSITRCDEWTSNATPWNYVMMIRPANLPEDKIKIVSRQFQLSPRQEETLGYLFQGLTSKEIGRCMDLSPHTVKIHIRALMNKLQVTTRTALVGCLLTAGSPEKRTAGR